MLKNIALMCYFVIIVASHFSALQAGHSLGTTGESKEAIDPLFRVFVLMLVELLLICIMS